MAANFRLNLNEVALLFIPENTQSEIKDACIVQVVVRSIGMAAKSVTLLNKAVLTIYFFRSILQPFTLC